jgi:hypothetical protein
MKKIIFSVIAIISFSLLSEAQVRIGVKAGGNISKQRVNVSHGNSIFSNDKYKSYHAGLISEFMISERFYLQPQLLYTRKGATLLSSTGAADTKVRISYIDLPINLVYKLPVSFGKIFGGAGAAFSYGFGGRLEQNGEKTKLYKGNAWKHEDVSLSFTAGVEFHNGLFASINSQKGLLDVYKADGASVKNRSMSISLGYMIDWNLLRKNHNN